MVKGVPVVMFHGVGPNRAGFPWNHLFTPLHVFEEQMRALAEEGWKTISLETLYRHMAEGTEIPEKSVVLTFDDGYLDNWVYAYPIIKRYGHHAVIWMSTDFVNPNPVVHPNLDDVRAGRVAESELEDRGYLSWEEMKRMIGDGTIEIQSHAKTHTWYFNSPEIIDFHRPRGVDGYVMPIWLAWNLFPERKYESMSVDFEGDVPYGTPIYANGKSLAVRRYFEDRRLTERLVEFVSMKGGAAFFKEPRWRERLEEIVDSFGPREDRTETEAEYEARVREELSVSKETLERGLSVNVDFLCWPGGGRSEKTLEIAREVGYLATTTHFYDPVRKNTYGQNPSEINRIGSSSPWTWHGRVLKETDGRFFTLGLEEFLERRSARWKLRFKKAYYIVRSSIKGGWEPLG